MMEIHLHGFEPDLETLVELYNKLKAKRDPQAEVIWEKIEPLLQRKIDEPADMDTAQNIMMDVLTDIKNNMQPDAWKSLAQSMVTCISEEEAQTRKCLDNTLRFLQREVENE